MENANLLYAVTMKELIRQVSLECNERGRLLENVWKSYIDLID
jgi:hypothetical protein